MSPILPIEGLANAPGVINVSFVLLTTLTMVCAVRFGARKSFPWGIAAGLAANAAILSRIPGVIFLAPLIAVTFVAAAPVATTSRSQVPRT